MGNITAVESILATDASFEASLRSCPSEECAPVTLQVVLLGSDGVVIASDTCAVNFNPRHPSFRTTDIISKIVVESQLVYTFAGDECAKKVGAAVAHQLREHSEPLSAELIEKVANGTLDEWRRNSCGNDRVDYRKNIWVQNTDARFAIWFALHNERDGKFEAVSCPVSYDGKGRVFAGDESNPARYIVERYYDKCPTRDISSLKRLAAHVILTGKTFSSNVSGLEMVVGNSNGFEWVPSEEIQELVNLSSRIHEESNRSFLAE
jgi:hypothetical protein